jgi:hypothetical protein
VKDPRSAVTSALTDAAPDYRPTFPPAYAPGVGIVGCGDIAKSWHLPAYGKYGVEVVGVYDPDPDATKDVPEWFRS